MLSTSFNAGLLVKKKKNFYPTIVEAGSAAAALGISDRVSYKKLYKKDKRLPSNPMRTYGLHWNDYKWQGFLDCYQPH